ncbi:hypothetical protein Ahy_B07g088484 [Arachis hypogaea]|uniref:Aminotransferase-like plant mobile domain-containing protein n=1 Tax=Arachis hypogaea TaxID=3818 RepID=A0A444YEM5_ARAHY|nr:hypothetical protein Ahy_B07g088484 [Arachis hypogaea]
MFLLNQPNRNLIVRKLDPPMTWNPMVENYLRSTGFYHVFRIGLIRGFYPLLAALVERCGPKTHSFVLPVGEVTMTLEDVAHIFGLPIDGEPMSEWTDSSSDFVQSQSIAISVTNRLSVLGWVRTIRDAEPLDTEESIKRYVRCQQGQSSRQSQHSQHGQSSQHSQPILYIPPRQEWIDFPSVPWQIPVDGHGDQQIQQWVNAGLGGCPDLTSIPSPAEVDDPHWASVDMAAGMRGPASDPTSERVSCDSGFIEMHAVFEVVAEFNPGASAPTEAGGSASPTIDDSVRGHSYDLRMERNPPDRYTPSRFGQGIMGKGLNWLGRKK